MRKKKYLAYVLSLVLVMGSIPVRAGADVSGKQADPLSENMVHRVWDGQNGDVLHYHYEDNLGREVTLQPSVRQRSSYKKAARVSGIPQVYDPRGTAAETPIRDQMDTGACWAFGALKSLEGNAIAQGMYTAGEADFSENHLAWYTYNRLRDKTSPLYGDYVDAARMGMLSSDNVYDIGGNALLATFTLANGWGAVPESEAPFASGAAMALQMQPLGDSIRDHSVMRLASVECYDDASRDVVKQAVLDNGAVDVSLYYPYQDELDEYMYQDEGTCSLYVDDYEIDDANHCVTIVGWDDTYDRFCKEPEAPGAWLIANSYGETENDGGYFWVSYYDSTLGDYYGFHGVSADTYATAFQYDGFGWGDFIASEQDISQANVFKNETEEPQELSAVSFYTLSDSQPYEINIYRNLGTWGPKDGEWVGRCTTKGTADYWGYHTVTLEQPIAVAPGETFSAVVTFHPVEDGAYVVFEGKNSLDSPFRYTGKVGQSYMYLAEENKWYDMVEEKYHNVCIKTLANPITAEQYEEQEKSYEPSVPSESPAGNTGTTGTQGTAGNASPTPMPTGGSTVAVTKIQCADKITMGVGEKVKLQVQIKPAAAVQTVSYQSSNTKVAVVQKDGTIRGKRTGTVRITVQASGVKKTVAVKVKKAPKSLRIVAKKKTLKKGKTMKLKVKLSGNSASYHLKYQSMDKGIASVSSQGKIKAKKTGTVRIKVTTFNGKKAQIKIKVVA